MRFKSVAFLLCFMVFLSAFSLAKPVVAADTEAPQITNVEVVTDINDSGDNYDTVPPRLNSIRNATIGQVGKDFSFQVDAYDELSGISEVQFEVIKPNGTQETYDLENKQSRWIKTFQFTEENIGEWTVKKITAKDGKGNVATKEFESNKFYIVPSHYQSYQEQYNNQTIKITDTHQVAKISFSKEMDEKTINKDNITLIEWTQTRRWENGQEDIYRYTNLEDFNITVSADKKSFYIKRNNPYQQGSQYYLIVHDNMKDLQGKKLSNPMYIQIEYVGTSTGGSGGGGGGAAPTPSTPTTSK